jgi:hypothetical protein
MYGLKLAFFRLGPVLFEHKTRDSQNWPCFPRARQSQDEYNREEEKVPLPMNRKLL